MKTETDRSDHEFRIFDNFDDAEKAERNEWMATPQLDRMILLEELRKQSYPDERISPQGLQRILTVVD